MRQNIKEHEGNKYLRRMHPALKDGAYDADGSMLVDVYEVLIAFNVQCPATAHAIKKLLCAGLRNKGDRLADLNGAMSALNRAIDIEESYKDLNPSEKQEDSPSHTYEVEVENNPNLKTITKPGRWEVVKALDEEGKVIGYRVRWSVPDNMSRYLWVRHYLSDNEPGSPALGWCLSAAERDAKALTSEPKFPSDYGFTPIDLGTR